MSALINTNFYYYNYFIQLQTKNTHAIGLKEFFFKFRFEMKQNFFETLYDIKLQTILYLIENIKENH